MAWENRPHSRNRYYVSVHKVAGRVKKVYVGPGPLGELVEAQDAARNAGRKAEAEAFKAEKERMKVTVGPAEDFLQTSDLLVRAVLTRAGFYRHHRGEWRKRRGRRGDVPTGETGRDGR